MSGVNRQVLKRLCSTPVKDLGYLELCRLKYEAKLLLAEDDLAEDIRGLEVVNQRYRQLLDDLAESFDLRLTWTKQPVSLFTIRIWLEEVRRVLGVTS